MTYRVLRLFMVILAIAGYVTVAKAQNKVVVRAVKMISKIQLPHMNRPFDIRVVSKYRLFIIADVNAERGEPILYAYSLDSLRLFRSFINQGDARQEMKNVGSIHYFDGEDQLYAFDIQKQRFAIISLDSLIKGSDNLITGYLGQENPSVIPYSGLRYQFPIILSGSNNIIERRQNHPDKPALLFDVYSPTGKLLQSAGTFPKLIPAYDGQTQYTIYLGIFSESNKGDEILYQSGYSQVLCLYDRKFNLLSQLIGYPENAGTENNIVRDTIVKKDWGYTSGRFARMNAKEIFIINEYPKNKTGENPGTNLYRFSKQLKPLARYILDPGVSIFDIDWKTKRIFAVDASRQLIVYKYY